MTNRTTCFNCTKLNNTTFLIVEDDKWYEVPFIYVKVYSSLLVLIDTGCGGAAKDSSVQLTSLREFIETYPVPDNGSRALNPESKKDYVVISSHCHFDHIGAMAQFTDAPKSTIWASSYDKHFVEGDGQLPTSSLCRFFEMETPKYKVTNWADDGQHVVDKDGKDLGLIVYHTPGHTPDEVAIWDPQERVIFVGDTMYEWLGIVFPIEGNLQLYSKSLERLKSLVEAWNGASSGSATDITAINNQAKGSVLVAPRVKVACGHKSSASDAQQLISEVDKFLYHVLEKRVEPRDPGYSFREEPLVSYKREDGKLSFVGPRKHFEEFREDEVAMQAIRKRHSQVT